MFIKPPVIVTIYISSITDYLYIFYVHFFKVKLFLLRAFIN